MEMQTLLIPLHDKMVLHVKGVTTPTKNDIAQIKRAFAGLSFDEAQNLLNQSKYAESLFLSR